VATVTPGAHLRKLIPSKIAEIASNGVAIFLVYKDSGMFGIYDACGSEQVGLHESVPNANAPHVLIPPYYSYTIIPQYYG
jgi:hypothetical protein